MRRMFDDEIFTRGKLRVLKFLRNANGKFLAREFLNDEKQVTTDEWARIVRIGELLSEIGHVHNKEHFNHETDGIYALKGFQVRIYAFRESDTWYLTNGCIKKKNRADPEQLKRAARLRDEYLKNRRSPPHG